MRSDLHMEEEQRRQIKQCLQALELDISDEMSGQLLLYYQLFTEKNKVMNLSAITEFDEVLEKHYLDSLSLVYALGDELSKNGKTLLDVGTGAGFPGIPLKIVYPMLDVTLADSLQKRVNFLDEVIEECRLEKITAVHGRAEDLGKKGSIYRENFDIVVSRAVANLCVLAEYCIPFVKEGGCFVSYKSGNAASEIEQASNAINKLGGELEKTLSFVLPGTDLRRSLVVIRKIKKTPGKYPRKAGLPGKQPL